MSDMEVLEQHLANQTADQRLCLVAEYINASWAVFDDDGDVLLGFCGSGGGEDRWSPLRDEDLQGFVAWIASGGAGSEPDWEYAETFAAESILYWRGA